MFSTKVKPEEIFTPKGPKVNTEMYIPRPELEGALTKAIRKPKHIIVHGESGSGKTWLYKNLFANKKIRYEVLNAAIIIDKASLSEAIKTIVSRLNPVIITGYDEKKSAEANIIAFKGNLEHQDKYVYQIQDPYYDLIKLIGNPNCKEKPSFFVIENMEHILSNQNYLKELTALILYLDDEKYSKYNVRLLLVGTPSNIRDYFHTIEFSQTIINRIQEIPEVSVLSVSQTKVLARRGLIEKQRFEVVNKDSNEFDEEYLLNAISWFTANIPQYIHELCLELSIQGEENNYLITHELYLNSVKCWVQEALISEHSRLEHNINSVETRHGRRNQIIYTLTQLETNEFNYNKVEIKLRELFPNSTNNKMLNVSGTLIKLSKGDQAILRKIPNRSHYRFIDPKILIMARWMLSLNASETITVKTFDDCIKF